MSPQRLRSIEKRLRQTLTTCVSQMTMRAQALQDVSDLLALARESLELPTPPINVHQLIEANAKRVHETAARLVAQFGVDSAPCTTK